MTTERRLRNTGIMFSLLLNWYAFCLIAISIINLSKLFVIPYVDLYSTILSAGIFGIALFASGERHSEKAEEFRTCYLELQSLYQKEMSISEKMGHYHEILKRYQNQTDDDYDAMLVNNHLRGVTLEDSKGKVVVTYTMIARVLLRRFAVLSLSLMLFVGPLIGTYFWIKPLSVAPTPVATVDTNSNLSEHP